MRTKENINPVQPSQTEIIPTYHGHFQRQVPLHRCAPVAKDYQGYVAEDGWPQQVKKANK